MIFKHNFDIPLRVINNKKEVSNKYILECFENIAELHSKSIDLGIDSILEEGITWVLLEWQVKVLKRPYYGQKIEVNTWARYTNKFYSYRDFEMYANGNLCAIATSKWLLIDIQKGRPARIQDKFMQRYSPEWSKEVLGVTEVEKLLEKGSYEKQDEYIVRRCDIDINGHMHNLNYLDLVYQMLSDEDVEKDFNNIRITYKKEIKYKDKVKTLYKKEEGKHCFIIKDAEEKTHALIELE